MNSVKTKGLAVAGIDNKNHHTIVTMLYFELLFTISQEKITDSHFWTF